MKTGKPMMNNNKMPELSITTNIEVENSTYCEFGNFISDRQEIDCRIIDKYGSATKTALLIVKAVNNHEKLIEALKQAKEDIILLTSNSLGQSTCEWSTQYIDDLLQSIEQQ